MAGPGSSLRQSSVSRHHGLLLVRRALLEVGCVLCSERHLALEEGSLRRKVESSLMVARRAESRACSGGSGLEAEGWAGRLLGFPAGGREGVCGSGGGQPEPSSTFPAHQDPSGLFPRSSRTLEAEPALLGDGHGAGDRMWGAGPPFPPDWGWAPSSFLHRPSLCCRLSPSLFCISLFKTEFALYL